MSYSYDTIFAVASGAGRAAVTVLRLSGARAGLALDALTRHRPAARMATVRRLRDADGEVLDQALVLWFPGPRSYTGEDCVELHLHGGRAVLASVSNALLALGLRPAEPGEFTRRAFVNGRLDLLEAEGIADLVEAETEGQRRQALRQMGGELSDTYRGWSQRLIRLLAHQEALIDFPDEDLPDEVETAASSEIHALDTEIQAHLDDGQRGERLREGLVFAIIGPPNSGKSTLINALARREVAIVSPQAGTTRDILEARVDLGGVAVTLLDTAGLRETENEVEAEGVRRAQAAMARADLVLLVSDGRDSEASLDHTEITRVLRIRTKLDLGGEVGSGLAVSALTGRGMAALETALTAVAQDLTQVEGPAALTRPRHRAALIQAQERLAAAAVAPWPELRTEDLRLALRALGRITGMVGVEDILDSIFLQFCIGK